MSSNDKIAKLVETMAAFEVALSSARSGGSSSQPNVALDLIQNLFVLFKEQVMGEINLIHARQVLQDEKLDSLETYSRRNCILVHGIPEDQARSEEECLTAATGMFSSKLGLNIPSNAIDRAHRLGPKRTQTNGSDRPPRPRPVIVKFKAYYDKRAVFTNKRKLKGQTFSISESLTKSRLALLKRAREHFSAGMVWTSDGKVLIKIEGQSSLKTVTTTRELDALIASFPTPHPAAGHMRPSPHATLTIPTSSLANVTTKRGTGTPSS